MHITNGDCLLEMSKLPEASIDVICTSPPYNIGLKYSSYDDKKVDYLDWMDLIRDQFFRILKNSGSVFINIGSTGSSPWISADVSDRFRSKFILQNKIVWVKAISIGDDPKDSHGHYKPINSDSYLNNMYEDIYHFTKTKHKIDRLSIGLPYKWKCNRTIRSTGEIKPDLKCRGNTWFVPYETIQNKSERFHHPSPFPVKLAEMCIKLHGIKKNMSVLDPFLGIGSTLVACKNLGIDNSIGIDIDPNYCHNSKRRLR